MVNISVIVPRAWRKSGSWGLECLQTVRKAEFFAGGPSVFGGGRVTRKQWSSGPSTGAPPARLCPTTETEAPTQPGKVGQVLPLFFFEKLTNFSAYLSERRREVREKSAAISSIYFSNIFFYITTSNDYLVGWLFGMFSSWGTCIANPFGSLFLQI